MRPKRISLNVFVFAALILALIAAGAAAGLSRRPPSPPAGGQESHLSGYQYISPLLECLQPSLPDKKTRSLEGLVRGLINEKISAGEASHISVYFRDLNNGPWFGVKEKENFSPASLLKVPLAIAYLKLEESQPALGQEKIRLGTEEQSDYKQVIKPRTSAAPGQEYTVDELLDYSLLYSDNNATLALLDHIGPADLDRVYTDLGLSVPDPKNPENYMSVVTYASFFRILYNASYLDRDASQRLLKLLSQVNFQNGLQAGIPAGVTVAHKFGERSLADSKQLHDCGIIYKPGYNYLLCVMTRGQDFAALENTVKDISALVYNGFGS